MKRQIWRVWDTTSGQFFCACKQRLYVGPCRAGLNGLYDPQHPHNGLFPCLGYHITAGGCLALLLALSVVDAAVLTQQLGLTLSLGEKSFFNFSFLEQLLWELLIHVNLYWQHSEEESLHNRNHRSQNRINQTQRKQVLLFLTDYLLKEGDLEMPNLNLWIIHCVYVAESDCLVQK